LIITRGHGKDQTLAIRGFGLQFIKKIVRIKRKPGLIADEKIYLLRKERPVSISGEIELLDGKTKKIYEEKKKRITK